MLKDTFTPMADHLRNEYGVTDMLTVDQIKAGIDGLCANNLLSDTPDLDQNSLKSGNENAVNINNFDLATWNSFRGKTVTMSFDISYSNYHQDTMLNNRIGFEYGITFNVNGKQSDANKGVWFSPTEASGSKHVSQSWLIFDYPIVRVENERSFYNQLSKEVKFKITNTRFTVNPMGG